MEDIAPPHPPLVFTAGEEGCNKPACAAKPGPATRPGYYGEVSPERVRKGVGHEDAAHNVRFDAMRPAHIENNALAAELASSLSTDASDFLAGQVIPISGGWVA